MAPNQFFVLVYLVVSGLFSCSLQTPSKDDPGTEDLNVINKSGIKTRTLYDYQTRLIAHKDLIESRCLLEFMKNGESLITQGTQDAKLNVPKGLFMSKNQLSKNQIWTLGGQRISDFCRGFPTYLVQEMETNPEILTNILAKEDFEIKKVTKRETKHFFVGRVRGQTQSQYLNYGNSKDPGKAEAESTYGGSKAVVSGSSGMGQAQSQSSPYGCEDCYEQSQGLQYGRPSGALVKPLEVGIPAPGHVPGYPGQIISGYPGYPGGQTVPGQPPYPPGQIGQIPGQISRVPGQQITGIPGQITGIPGQQITGIPGQITGIPGQQITGIPGQITGIPGQIPGTITGPGQQIPGQIVGPPGGQILAPPGGQIVGQPGGQIVRQPGGQIISYPGGQIPAQPGGQIVGQPVGPLIQTPGQLPGYPAPIGIPGPLITDTRYPAQIHYPGSQTVTVPSGLQPSYPGYQPGYPSALTYPSGQVPGYPSPQLPGYPGAGQQIYVPAPTGPGVGYPGQIGHPDSGRSQIVETDGRGGTTGGKFSGRLSGDYESQTAQRGKFSGIFSGEYDGYQNGKVAKIQAGQPGLLTVTGQIPPGVPGTAGQPGQYLLPPSGQPGGYVITPGTPGTAGHVQVPGYPPGAGQYVPGITGYIPGHPGYGGQIIPGGGVQTGQPGYVVPPPGTGQLTQIPAQPGYVIPPQPQGTGTVPGQLTQIPAQPGYVVPPPSGTQIPAQPGYVVPPPSGTQIPAQSGYVVPPPSGAQIPAQPGYGIITPSQPGYGTVLGQLTYPPLAETVSQPGYGIVGQPATVTGTVPPGYGTVGQPVYGTVPGTGVQPGYGIVPGISGQPGYGTIPGTTTGYVPGIPGTVGQPGYGVTTGTQVEGGYYDQYGRFVAATAPEEDDSDSQVQTSVQQTNNETQASASAQGKFGGGTAQSQVSGTYTGGGSFTASAGSDDGKRGAMTQVSGGKEGAQSLAQGRGGLGQSQVQVQLDSDTGLTMSSAQSGGHEHGTQSQVQGSSKGGMADAQANGPGLTSSQAQIGFTPYDELEEDNQTSPFRGGGSASAQGGSLTGQTQSQITGQFFQGIRYVGVAQAGSGTPDAVAKARNQTRPNGLSATFPTFKPITYSSGTSRQTQVVQAVPTSQKVTRKNRLDPTTETPIIETSTDPSTLTYNSTDNEDYDYDEDYENEYSTEKPATRSIITQQTNKQQKQHIVLDPLEDLDATVFQSAGDNLPDGTVLQPGDPVPGSTGYRIPPGFRGRVKSIANGPKTYTTGQNSQAQSVTLTPGTGRIIYKRPTYSVGTNTQSINGRYSYGSGYTSQPYQYQVKSGKSLPNFISVSKSEMGSTNLYSGKKTPSVYYTQSSSCGVFTNTCVFNGSRKVCFPKAKTNPDGTLMGC